MKKYLIVAVFLFSIFLVESNQQVRIVEAQAVSPLDNWVLTSSPVVSITQRVASRPIQITGLSTGQCLTLDGNHVLTTTACGSGGGSGSGTISTSTPAVQGNLLYFTGPSTVGNVATGTISSSGGITTTAGRSAIGGALAIACTQASGSAAGCLASTDWSQFNARLSTSSLAILVSQGLTFSTTSSNVWAAAGLGFSTTSAAYFSAAGLAFSTTSTNYWLTQQNVSGFSTTSANYWASLGLAFSTSSATYNFITNLAATTSVKSITTLPTLSLPYTQITGVPAFDTFAYPFINNATTSSLTFGGATTTGTLFVAASTTLGTTLSGAGLGTCNGSNFLQWTTGVFGCAASSGSASVGNWFVPTTYGTSPANATSTLIGFNQGLYSIAGSSTIGNGVSSLTLNGNSTTTGTLSVNANTPLGGGGSAVTINQLASGGSALIVNNSTPTTLLNVGFGDGFNYTFPSIEGSNGTIVQFGGGSAISAPGNFFLINPLSVDPTADTFRVQENGVDRLLVNGNGLVGVGTTTPVQLLSVQGNAYLSGNLSSVANITATGTIIFSAISNGCLNITGGTVGSQACSSGSVGNWFTPAIQNGAVNSTTTAIFDTLGLQASSTSFFSAVSSRSNQGSSLVPGTFISDSSAVPVTLIASDALNFANTSDIAQFSQLNAGDSGAVLKLSNAGTGNFETAVAGGVNKFIVTSAGVASTTNLTISALGVAAGAFLATNASGNVIATTSPQVALTLTTTGSSGAATLSPSGALNIPQYSGSTGAAFPFTPTTNFGALTNATGTPIWFQAGLQASSTSQIASTTFSINGNVGIGSSSPTSLLTLIQNNTSALFTAFTIDGVTAGAGAEMALNRGSNTGTEEANIDFNTNGAEFWQLGLQNNSTNDFELWDGQDDPAFTIKTGTNFIGFGTTTPFGDFAINADYGDVLPGNLIFNIASSSLTATTSLFSVSNTGSIKTNYATGCITSSSGVLSSTGTSCGGAGSGQSPYTWTVAASGGSFTTIQGALDACGTAGGGNIILTDKSYAQGTTGLLWKGSNCAIWGRGPGTTTITYTGATTYIKTNSAAGDFTHDEIHNIFFSGDSNASSVAINWSDMTHGIVDDVQTSGVGTSLLLNDTQNITFYNAFTNLDFNNNIAFCINASSTNPVNANKFENIFCGDAATSNVVGLQLNNGNGNSFNLINLEPGSLTGTVGINIFDNKLATNNGVFNNTFSNFYVEANATGVKIATTVNPAAGGIQRNTFENITSEANTVDWSVSNAAIALNTINGYDSNFGAPINLIGGPLGIGTSTSLSTPLRATENAMLMVNASSTQADNAVLVGAAQTTLLRVSTAGLMFAPNTGSSGSAQTGYWCYDANGQFIRDTALCLTSAARFKQDISDISDSTALTEALALQPVSYYYRPDFNGSFQSDPNYSSEQVGFIADQVQQVDPRLVSVETATTTFEGQTYAPGTVQTFRPDAIAAMLAGAIRAQQTELEALKPAAKTAEDNWQWAAIALLIGWNVWLTARRKK